MIHPVYTDFAPPTVVIPWWFGSLTDGTLFMLWFVGGSVVKGLCAPIDGNIQNQRI